MDDSTYIGKATFKRNQFAHASNISRQPEQSAYIKSLRRNNEELEKMASDLDRTIREKKEALKKSEIFILKQFLVCNQSLGIWRTMSATHAGWI